MCSIVDVVVVVTANALLLLLMQYDIYIQMRCYYHITRSHIYYVFFCRLARC